MQPLPDEALHHSLRYRQLQGLGIGRAEFEGRLWRHPYHDVYAWGAVTDPLDRIRDAALLLPDGCAVGGWAAAHVLGARHADGETSAGRPLDVLLCLQRPDQVRKRAGLNRFRSALDVEDVIEVCGIPVTTPVRTCFDLARLAGTVEEAVVLLDGALRDLGVTVEEVADYARQRPRWRGLPRCRVGLSLADPRSVSPGESMLRLDWLAAGLPRPDVNREVLTLGGRLLGVGDLVLGDVGLVGEYDGAGHREGTRHAADNAREEGMEDAGLVVVRSSSPDRANRRALRARLAAGYERARTWRRPTTWVLGAFRAPTP